MDCAQIFNPFRIFDRTVERRFTIRPRDYDKYTEDQLHEHIPCQLRTFAIDDQIWYLAKDVCSFLGITPNHVSQTLENIENAYIRKETIILSNTSDLEDRSQVSQGRNVYLLNESGVYAAIQKSKTTYAQDFKHWLNADVLPSMRANGKYELGAEMKEDLESINENLEQEAFGARMTDDDERRIEFETILKERDQIMQDLQAKEVIIKEKEEIIVEQKHVIETKDTSLNEMMVFLRTMKDENARKMDLMIAENARNCDTMTQNINSLRSDNQLMRTDIQRLSRDNQVIRAKLDIVIRDRVINTEDDGKHSTFNLYRTNESDLENKQYPYCIIRCQRKRIADNEKRMRKRYPSATLIYSLENPNAESLFQVLKERAKNDNIGLIFDKTSFYIDADHENMTIDDVVTLIRSIERERVEIE